MFFALCRRKPLGKSFAFCAETHFGRLAGFFPLLVCQRFGRSERRSLRARRKRRQKPEAGPGVHDGRTFGGRPHRYILPFRRGVSLREVAQREWHLVSHVGGGERYLEIAVFLMRNVFCESFLMRIMLRMSVVNKLREQTSSTSIEDNRHE